MLEVIVKINHKIALQYMNLSCRIGVSINKQGDKHDGIQ